MTARIGNIALDCDDVLKIATFWSAVLGRPLDKGSSGQFASIGGTDAAGPRWPACCSARRTRAGTCR